MRMIVGAGALSIKKLAYVPSSIDAIDTITETHSIVENLRMNKNAMAPGPISKPIARIRPAADSVATMVSESAASIP